MHTAPTPPPPLEVKTFCLIGPEMIKKKSIVEMVQLIILVHFQQFEDFTLKILKVLRFWHLQVYHSNINYMVPVLEV